MVIFKRQHSCYRPLQLDKIQLARIVLYNEHKQIMINSGWLEDCNSTEVFYRTSDITSITLSDVRKANKLNLDKHDNFILRYSDNLKGFNDSGYALYIYIKDIDFLKTLSIDDDDNLRTHHADYYSINLDCETIQPELDTDKKLKYVCRPKQTITICTNHRFTDTDKFGRLKPLLADISDVLGKDILNARQLNLLLSKFKIEPIIANQ